MSVREFNYVLQLQIVDENNEHLKERYYDKVREMAEPKHLNNPYKDSGFDIYMPKDVKFEYTRTQLVPFGIKCAAYKIIKNSVNKKRIPQPYDLVPRSSIYKTPFRQSNCIGIIDSGYRGELMAPIDVDQFALQSGPQFIKKDSRLFQIVMPNREPFRVELVKELDETYRGEGGFGSTGN
jgi:dUTP pyrophosphatase